MLRSFLITAALMIFLVNNANSQSLYGTGISPESALVRVIYADSVENPDIEIGNIIFTAANVQESSFYHPVSPGMYFFELGNDWIEFIPQSGKYFSLIISKGNCIVFEDMEHKAPAKAQIYFYNLLEKSDASLVVSGSLDIVLENVKPLDSSQIAINPLNIEFAISTDLDEQIEIGSIPMKRGGSTSVILMKDNDGLKTMTVEAEVALGK